MNYVRLNNLSLKYQRFTPSGCIHIGMRKFEFVAKNQFLSIWIVEGNRIFLLLMQRGILIHDITITIYQIMIKHLKNQIVLWIIFILRYAEEGSDVYSDYRYCFQFLPPFHQHYRPMIPPNRGRLSYFTSLQIIQLSNHAPCKVYVKKFGHFHLKRPYNCVQQLFQENKKILLNHGFLRPILPAKHPLLRFG